ncbi:MAG: sugar porter family MFS transporter [Pirellulales bacterium]|nr:sugar porter family MFS transporter [Pirellulales bacterium]
MVGPAVASGGSTLQGERKPGFLFLITFVAAMGGLLFGYDWVVIGGAAKFYEANFHLQDTAATLSKNLSLGENLRAVVISPVGWAQSCALLGCLLGALLSGWLSDRFGRKPLLIVAAANFIVSSIGIALVDRFMPFIIWRILGGVGIGLASTVSPMYISEIAPANRRGLLVAVNQLTIVIGILAAQLINLAIARPESDTPELSAISAAFRDLSGEPLQTAKEKYQVVLASTWNGKVGWRWMFAACAVPSLFFFLGSLIVPESPRWLTKAGRNEKAREILTRIGGARYAAAAEEEIRATLLHEDAHVRLSELFEKGVRFVLLLGCALAVVQQWCGINVIFNYATEIFTQAGFNMDNALTNIAATGVVNLLFVFVALATVDKLGRKPLMLLGFVGLSAIYIVLGYCYYLKGGSTLVSPWIFLTLVLAAIGLYSMTLAPVVWVLISEIFPNRIRGTAMSLAVGSLWIACFILTYSFPILKTLLGISTTFWIYAGLCAIGALGISVFLPETKGKSLEQIERELTGR